MPIYDGGARAALSEQARDKVDKISTTLTQIRNEATPPNHRGEKYAENKFICV